VPSEFFLQWFWRVTGIVLGKSPEIAPFSLISPRAGPHRFPKDLALRDTAGSGIPGAMGSPGQS